MEMDYSDLNVDQIVKEVYAAEAEGRTRPATKQETMAIRLAALNTLVKKTQETINNDKERASA